MDNGKDGVGTVPRYLLGLIAMTFLGTFLLRAQQQESSSRPLTAHEIVKNLEQRNQARAEALHRFEGTRVYTLHYHGFPHSYDAEMVVSLTYQSPASKEFTVVSQSGSKFVIDSTSSVAEKWIDSTSDRISILSTSVTR